MKQLLSILILSSFILFSCKKGAEDTTQRQHNRIDDYVTFISASKTVLSPTSAQAIINVNVINSREISELHIYAFHDTYQYYIPVIDGSESVTDKFIIPTDQSRQYYFTCTLTTTEKIIGNTFTVNF